MGKSPAKDRVSGRGRCRGIALLLTMGILLLLTLLALSFSSDQLTENQAARNFYYAVKAEELALGGLDAAMAVLAEDAQDNSYDHLEERWAILYGKDDGFAGDEDEDADLADIDELESGEDPDDPSDRMPDSRWIEVHAAEPGTRRAELVGRYAVCIEDENGKVNINVAGNPYPYSDKWQHRRNMGFTTSEIDLGGIFEQLGRHFRVVLDLSGYPRNVSEDTALDVVQFRYGWDELLGRSVREAPGQERRDDTFTNRMPRLLRQDMNGIDDDGDGLIDEPGEEVDEPGEFAPYNPVEIGPPGEIPPARVSSVPTTGILGNDTPFLTVSHVRMVRKLSGSADFSISDRDNNKLYRSLLPYITVYSEDLNRFSSEDLGARSGRTGVTWMIRENVGRWLDGEPSDVFDSLGWMKRRGIAFTSTTDDELEQIAVNIYDFIDADWIPTRYGDVFGVEPTAYINEVEPTPPIQGAESLGIEGFIEDYWEYIELFNPYDVALDISDYQVTIAPGVSRRIGSIAGGSTVMGPRQFFLIGDTQGIVVDTGQGGTRSERTDLPGRPTGCQAYAPLKVNVGQDMVLEMSVGRRRHIIESSAIAGGGLTSPDGLTAQKDDPRVGEWNVLSGTPGSLNGGMTNRGDLFSYFYMPGVRARAGDPDYDPTDQKLIEHGGGLSNIGELGAAHRGEKWMSLNFTGEGTYSGDIKLLDVLTMPYPYPHEGLRKMYGDLPAPEVVAGRININTAPPDVLYGLNWDAVMEELRFHGGRVPSIARLVKDMTANRPYENLADVAAKFAGLAAVKGLPEPAREAFMKYNANLITTKSSVFKVTVLAEVFDRRGNVAATRKLEAVVDRGYTPDSMGRPDEPRPTQEEQARAATARVLQFRWITED